MRTKAQGGDGDGNGRWMGMTGSDDVMAENPRWEDGVEGVGCSGVDFFD